MWLSLLSKELLVLIDDAESSEWPFVPEKWQYISTVGPEESYNIKELITSRNAVVTSLTELDIMQECVHHAVVMKRYSKLAALVFVMDRFMYWQEGSRTTMRLVDFLQASSPLTPIAPQLVIRKARVMKNDGNLQGAEQTLDMLLTEKQVLGQWRYKEEHDHRLVSAVCVQIKGDIQYTLGQWMQGAGLLLESILGFKSLPKPDKKGLSASNGLLANCLQNMSVPEYLYLAPSFNLGEGHPLLEAYRCCTESASFSQFTPMFFSRHKGQAGAILLEYSKQLRDEKQRQTALQAAVQDLKASIQSHRTISSLTSREEFFIFNAALFRLSLALNDSSSKGAFEVGQILLSISKVLYEHYCSFGKVVLLDEKTTGLISLALNILGLEQFTVEEISGTVLKTKQSLDSQFLKAFQRMPAIEMSPIGTNQDLSAPQITLPQTQGLDDQNARIDPSRRNPDVQGKNPLLQNASTKETFSSLELVEQLKRAATVSQSEVTSDSTVDLKSDWLDNENVAAAKETAKCNYDKNFLATNEVVGLSTPIVGSCKDEKESTSKYLTSIKSNTSWEVIEKGAGASLGCNTIYPVVDQEAATKETTSFDKGIDEPVDQDAITRETASIESKSNWVLVDQEAVTKETTSFECKTDWDAVEQKSLTRGTKNFDSKIDGAVEDREIETKEKNTFDFKTDGAVVDQEAATRETSSVDNLKRDQIGVTEESLRKGNCASTVDNSIIAQGLENETAELPMQLIIPGTTFYSSAASQLKTQFGKTERVYEAVAWKYDPIHETWKGKTTLAFVGTPLALAKGKKGSQRDAFNVEYMDQDEPMGRYVAKRYQKARSTKQYQQDIICQMTARYYVGLFNQQLYQSGIQAGSIQFLPVALLQMIEKESGTNIIYNVEPFMAGEFTKLTNNLDFAERSGSGTDLVLAFGHFTYKASGGKLIVVDIQGWVPDDNRSCMFLTDPQIHSPVYKCFGTGNFGREGFDRFWSKMHPECNAICRKLRLERP